MPFPMRRGGRGLAESCCEVSIGPPKRAVWRGGESSCAVFAVASPRSEALANALVVFASLRAMKERTEGGLDCS